MRDETYNKIIWFGVAAILVFTPIARGAVRIYSTIPFVPIAILFFLWLWKRNSSPSAVKPRLQGRGLNRPIIALALLAIASCAFSIYKHASFYALLRLFGYIGLYYLVVNNLGRPIRRRLFWIIIYTGAGISVYGLLQYTGILSHSWWANEKFLSATYVNHNHFAGYLALVIPMTVGALLRYRPKPTLKRYELTNHSLGLTLALFVMLMALVMSQSRGAWISLFISFLVMAIILIKTRILSKRNIFIFALFLAVILLFLYSERNLLTERIETIVGMETEEASIKARFKVWKGAIEMVRNNPWFGTGIGTFVWGFPLYKPTELDFRVFFAHNDYLHMAAEMGIIAPIIMLWLLIVAIKNALTKRRSHPLALGCGIGILSLALHGIVDFNFHVPANMILCVIYAAFIMRDEEKG